MASGQAWAACCSRVPQKPQDAFWVAVIVVVWRVVAVIVCSLGLLISMAL